MFMAIDGFVVHMYLHRGVCGGVKFSSAIIEDAGTKVGDNHFVSCIQVPQRLIPPQRNLKDLFTTHQVKILDGNASASHPHPTQLQN